MAGEPVGVKAAGPGACPNETPQRGRAPRWGLDVVLELVGLCARVSHNGTFFYPL